MPIDIISTAYFDGPGAIPGWNFVKNYGPYIATAAAVKYYFGGSSNTWNRDMHGRVFIITGGTSGVGAQVAYDLAMKGAQLILLCRSTEDAWTSEYVEDLREKTNNFMIYAELCDLSLLHSVRLFATTFLDNQPPRRLDGVICCAAECIPRGTPRQVSVDGVELQIAVNYLAHYHLLTLLKPAMHVQPPDRDFRVVLTTCSSQALGEIDKEDLLWESRQYPVYKPWSVYGTSKLLLGMFGRLLQRDLNDYQRKDKAPCNIKVSVVNPGLMRSPSTRRFLSMGSIMGLFIYLLFYPIWFLFLKSSGQGAQSLLFAIASPILGAQDGGNLVQECKLVTKGRKELWDYELQDVVYAKTAELIAGLEKLSAIERKKADKASGADRKKKAEQQKKKEDLREKPLNEDELDYKLRMMKKSLGLPMGSGSESLFSEAKTLAVKKSKARKR
ncbi:CIC11C00000001659 [Sungouiella intermedia]|uniref:CIC11C00000001659 n=1 Tax=Sungouiella intermedia TaxID=45354 RepID=A0A1L0C581_9ASCO|nr:CIC11C00000001659 [[Candida] intermedia]